MGEAFCELIETYPRDTAPKLGRIDGTFLVTFPLDSMLTGLGTATLDDGTPISRRPGDPVGVRGAGSSPSSSVGRARSCTRAGPGGATPQPRPTRCTPATKAAPRGAATGRQGLCHAHHDIPYSQGGNTDIDDGRLLCPHHHARAHDPAYAMTVHADNKVTFHRRP